MGSIQKPRSLDRRVKAPLLILAHSGRMLAGSANAAGYVPLVLDLYADCDTVALGRAWRIPAEPGGGFEPLSLLQTALGVIDDFSPVAWLYGSGVDRLPRVITHLGSRCRLYGNGAEVTEMCVQPHSFFSLLDRLDIAHPQIRWDPPSESGWLLKCGGEGGRGVLMAAKANQVDNAYYQKRLDGAAYTLSFVAGGGQLLWFGFNRLYTKAYNDRLHFLFAGAINRTCLDTQTEKVVVNYARRLCQCLHLQGWHGLDFMLDLAGVPRVLELNPRPGAVLELWEEPGWSSIEAHVRGCEGKGIRARPPGKVRAFQILYAEDSLRIPMDWQWPAWCADLPRPGTVIPAGHPVCSIKAKGEEVVSVERILQQRTRWLERRLFNRTTAKVDES